MTVELLVMRHAKSDWSVGGRDFDRPLNSRGERAADRMAAWVVANDLIPDAVLSSSAQRARATALAIVHGCGVDRRQLEFDDQLYHADAFTWLQMLTRQDPAIERLLICGHNPGLDELVETLATSPPRWTASGKLMTTAAIAHFRFEGEWSAIGPQTGDLVALVRPRELAD